MTGFGKVYLMAAFALILAGLSFAIPIASCGAISSPGSYELSNDISAGNGTCINITAPGVTLDCTGFSINGPGTYPSFGVYSNQPSTVVKNCRINDFYAGIFFANVSGGEIRGNTIATNVRSGTGIWLVRGTGNLLDGNIATVTGAYTATPIYLQGSSWNVLTGNQGNGNLWIGIVLWDLNGAGADHNTLIGNTGSGAADGIILWGSSYNNLTNNTGTGTGNPGRGIYLVSSNGNYLSGNTGRATASTSYMGVVGIDLIWSSNNVLENNIADSQGGRGIGLYGDNATGPSNGNTFRANTVYSPYNEVGISGIASGNSFYYNTFRDTAGVYVRDESGGNTWSIFSGGVNKGNYWYNVINSRNNLQIRDKPPRDGWGDSGPGYPFSQATSEGKFVGTGADSGPCITPLLCIW